MIGPAIAGLAGDPLKDAMCPDRTSDRLKEVQGTLNGKIEGWRVAVTKVAAEDSEILHSLLELLAGGGDSGTGIIDEVVRSYTIPLYYTQIKIMIYVFFLTVVVMALVFI